MVLYFYPKDDTPGCTKQACDLRDDWGVFGTEREGVRISRDDVASHERFREKFSLPFQLLADPDHAVAEAYGSGARRRTTARRTWGSAAAPS